MTSPLRPQSAEQLDIKTFVRRYASEHIPDWQLYGFKTSDVITILEAYARAAEEEREQASNLFWPPEDEFEEHIYEIRNGKTADYVRAHALALAGTFAGAGESPATAPQRWTDQDLYDAYLHGCEDDCLPEPLDKETFLASWEDVQDVQ